MPPIISMSAYEEVKNVLVFGDSGIGKTVLTGTIPRGLILGVEQGLVSAKAAGSTADLWKIESWGGSAQDTDAENNLRAAYRWLSKGGYRKYAWLGVDGITEMQEMAKMQLLADGIELDPNASEYVLEWQSNLALQQMTKIMVKNFCKMPINTVFTALPMDMDDAEGENKVMPFIDGKKGAISQYVCGQMGAVGYMKQIAVRQGKEKIFRRRVYWQYRKPYFGKNRFGLPAYTDDLSVPQLVALMKDKKPVSARPVRRTARVTGR